MNFRLELSPDLLRRLYRWLVSFVAAMTALYMVTLPIGLAWKAAGLVALAAGTWLALRQIARLVAAETFSPLRINGWAFFAFLITLVVLHAPVYRGEQFLGDWAKHRSVMMSLHDGLIEPKATGFLYDETAEDSPIPGNHHLNYYYLPYIAPVLTYAPMHALIPDYSVECVARVMAALLSIWSLALLLVSLALVLSTSTLLWRDGAAISERTVTVFLLLLPLWGGAEFFLEIYREGTLPRLGAHYDGIIYDFFPFQIQNTVSLWNWVPSQVAAAAVGLALLMPFVKRVEAAPWTLIVAYLMGSVPFALFGLGPVALFGLLQNRERYTVSWLRGHAARTAVSFALAGVAGWQALVFFDAKMQRDAFQWIFTVNPSLLNFGISVTRELAAPITVLAGLACKRAISWPAFTGLTLALLAMTTVYLGQFNPWALKATMPVTLLLPLFFAVLLRRTERRRTRWLALVLALVFMLPSFWYECFFAWNDGSGDRVLEKTKWIVVQYLSR